MITTTNLVNIHRHTQLQNCFLVLRTFKIYSLNTLRYTIEYCQLQSPCCVPHHQDVFILYPEVVSFDHLRPFHPPPTGRNQSVLVSLSFVVVLVGTEELCTSVLAILLLLNFAHCHCACEEELGVSGSFSRVRKRVSMS